MNSDDFVHSRDGADRRFLHRSGMPVPAGAVADWHFRAGALDRLLPPWQDVRVEVDAPEMVAGADTVLSVPLGPIRKRWHARIEEAIPGSRFVDVQVSGPFGAWRHEHRFLDAGPSGSVLEDDIVYRMPFRPLGDLGAGKVRADLEQLFRWRHFRTDSDLRRHAEEGPGRPWCVVVTGSSGLIGRQLCAFLTTGGHHVRRLVRRDPDRTAGEYRWNPEAGAIEPAAFEGADAVVHLAGAGIADERWTDERMRVIRESRVKGTTLIAETLASLGAPPRVFVSTSAVGIYGDRAAPVDDGGPVGESWLAEVARDWEAAAEPARRAGIRVVHPRIGIVLTPKGGALGKMLTPFKFGLGGVVGSGEQMMSWIGIDDVIAAIHRSMADESFEGAFNATAPEPVSQREFAKVLGRVLGRPAVSPLPAVVARGVFGRMAGPLLLEGVAAIPSGLVSRDFRFEADGLETCLRLLLQGRPPSA